MNNDLISRSALLERLNKVAMPDDCYSMGIQRGVDHAKEVIAEAPAVDAGPKWISVEERLPVEEAIHYIRKHDDLPEYLVCIKGAELPTTLLFTGDGWTDGDGTYYHVTHWMHLPELPKEV